MFIAPASRIRLLSCLVPLACSLSFLACGSATVTGGTGGTGATGTGGANTGTGGSHTGGATGTGGRAPAARTGLAVPAPAAQAALAASPARVVPAPAAQAAPAASPARAAAEPAGRPAAATGGKGGQAGSTGGTAGSSSGFSPMSARQGLSSPSASAIPAGSTATKIAGAPPSDTFKQQRQQLHQRRRAGLDRQRPLLLGDDERDQPAAVAHPEDRLRATQSPSSIRRAAAATPARTGWRSTRTGTSSPPTTASAASSASPFPAGPRRRSSAPSAASGSTRPTISPSAATERSTSPTRTSRRRARIPQPNTGVYMVPPGIIRPRRSSSAT